jgi:hypothetical protein
VPPARPGAEKAAKSLKWTEENQIWIKIEILEGKEYTGRQDEPRHAARGPESKSYKKSCKGEISDAGNDPE